MGAKAGRLAKDYDYREVRHCRKCGAPLFGLPTLVCQKCKSEIKLRSFVYRDREGYYIAECIDLNILGQGKTPEEAIGALQEAVIGYLETVLTGDPTGLVLRKSPLVNRIRFYLHRLGNIFNHQHDLSHEGSTFTVRIPAQCC